MSGFLSCELTKGWVSPVFGAGSSPVGFAGSILLLTWTFIKSLACTLFSGMSGFLSCWFTRGWVSFVFGAGSRPVGLPGLILFVTWTFMRSFAWTLFSGMRGFFNYWLTNGCVSLVFGAGSSPVGLPGLICASWCPSLLSSTVTSDLSSFFSYYGYCFLSFFSSLISCSVFYPSELAFFKPGLAVAPVGFGLPPAVGAGIGIPPFSACFSCWAKSCSWSFIELMFYWWTTSSSKLNLSISWLYLPLTSFSSTLVCLLSSSSLFSCSFSWTNLPYT